MFTLVKSLVTRGGRDLGPSCPSSPSSRRTSALAPGGGGEAEVRRDDVETTETQSGPSARCRVAIGFASEVINGFTLEEAPRGSPKARNSYRAKAKKENHPRVTRLSRASSTSKQ